MWGVDQGAITIAAPAGQRIVLPVAAAIPIAQHRLELGDDLPGDAPGIGLIDYLLDLFRYQFIALNQGFSNSHKRLAVLLE